MARARRVRSLLDLVAGTDVEELEVEHEGARVLIRRAPSPRLLDSAVDSEAASATARGSADADSADDAPVTVTSPVVGLFFRGRERGDPPLVSEGDAVTAGQPVAMVESLRIPNLLEAPADGVVEQILADDGMPVEYGQPVLIIRPTA